MNRTTLFIGLSLIVFSCSESREKNQTSTPDKDKSAELYLEKLEGF